MGVEYWCSRFELGNGEGERGVEEAGWDFESGITSGKKKGLVNLLNDRESAMKQNTTGFGFGGAYAMLASVFASNGVTVKCESDLKNLNWFLVNFF